MHHGALACPFVFLFACGPGSRAIDGGPCIGDACDDAIGSMVCSPGTGTCNGETSHRCRDDGTGYEDIACDPVQDLHCNADTGACEGACSPWNLGKSYVGCEYYPTVTANVVPSEFEFAVVVSNTSSDTAHVTIEDGGLATPRQFDVLADEV